jgi:hypothetical protein
MAQRDRGREEGDEMAVPPPYRETWQGTSSAGNWEDGSIAVQNQGGRGGRKDASSDKIKAVSKKVFNALASVNNQHSAKKVDAGDHVLETYHDSFLYGRVPLPVKVRSSLRGGYIGYGWHIVRALTTVLLTAKDSAFLFCDGMFFLILLMVLQPCKLSVFMVPICNRICVWSSVQWEVFSTVFIPFLDDLTPDVLFLMCLKLGAAGVFFCPCIWSSICLFNVSSLTLLPFKKFLCSKCFVSQQ